MFSEQKEYIKIVSEHRKKKSGLIQAMRSLYEYSVVMKKDLVKLESKDFQNLEKFLSKKHSVNHTYTQMMAIKRFFRYLDREEVFYGIEIKKPWEKKGRERKKRPPEICDYLAEKHGLRENANSFDVFNEYLSESGITLTRLSAKQAQEFQQYLMTLVKKGKSPRFKKNTVRHIISDLSMFYGWLKKEKRVFSNPFAAIRKIRAGNELPRSVVSEESMNDLLERLSVFYANPIVREKKQGFKAHVIGELLYSTGLTYKQMMDLKVPDIDFIRGTVTTKERYCVLNEYALKVLRIYVEKMRKYYIKPDEERVFNAPVNTKMKFNQILQKHCKILELPKLTLRELRNIYILHLIKGGCDLRYVQELSGHKDIETTGRYLKAERRDLKNVLDIYHPRKEAGSEKL